jgi:hypothetical protein
VSLPPVPFAYIGPGAGFAFLGSFLTLIVGLLLGALSVVVWPFRSIWRWLRRRNTHRRPSVRKVIVLGLDGLDPVIAERMMHEGKLPHLAALRERGCYQRLRTTFPALSPVAWSTFATGSNPAKHNIFDFLDRDLRTYLPQLSSAHVGKPRRIWKVGRFRIPLSRTPVDFRRKSRSPSRCECASRHRTKWSWRSPVCLIRCAQESTRPGFRSSSDLLSDRKHTDWRGSW